MRSAPEKLIKILRPVVEGMGYEFVGVEMHQRSGHGGLLRVYIDRDQGITLDDCGAVSHQISGVLDVEDLIAGQYSLEVSSPGLDRPLYELAHFARFRGHRARMKLAMKIGNRRKIDGRIKNVEQDTLVVETDGEEIRLTLDQIDSARIIPEF